MADRYYPDNVPKEYNPEWLAMEHARIYEGLQPYMGVWTPELWDASFSGNEGQTYLVQEGFFFKFGNIVHFTGRMVVTGLGTLTGANVAYVGGLPFYCTADPNWGSGMVSIGYGVGLTLGGAYAVSGHPVANLNAFALHKWSGGAGSTSVTITQFGTGEIRFGGFYVVDEE